MSLAKGRFGIEYDPRRRRDDSSGPGWLVLVVAAAAAVSFSVTAVKRAMEKDAEPLPQALTAPSGAPSAAAPASDAPAPATDAPAGSRDTPAANPAANAAATPPPTPPPPVAPSQPNRPSRVRNLLLRLDEAEKAGNVPMAVTTIETLRALPGEPAADLDDRLARRLGELNDRWLFELAGKQWVDEVKVRKGESASRIASSKGSTLASLVRLNPQLKDPDHLRPGQTVKVMNHPRLSLTVHRRARYADLHLNGKFFRRCDLAAEVAGKVGVYKVEQSPRPLFKSLGLAFSLRDRIALETLLPKGSTIIVSET